MTYKEAQLQGYTFSASTLSRRSKEIVEAYQEAYNEINKKLRNLYLKIMEEGIPEKEYYNYMTKFNRLDNLQKSIYAEYLKAAKIQRRVQIAAGEQATREIFYRNTYLINWSKPAKELFVVMNPQVVEAIVIGSPEIWKEIKQSVKDIYGDAGGYLPQHGTLLETLLENRTKDLKKMRNSLTQGFIQGKGYQEQAREIRDILKTTKANALRIARTEGNRNMNAGHYASTNVARDEGIEIFRQWIAEFTVKTKPHNPPHQNIDGQNENENGIFHIGDGITARYPGATTSTSHNINCHCSVIDIVEGITPQTRRARDPVTGETDIISYKNYSDWMASNGMKYTGSGWVNK